MSDHINDPSELSEQPVSKVGLSRMIVLLTGFIAAICFFLPWYNVYFDVATTMPSAFGDLDTQGSATGFHGLNRFIWVLLLVYLVLLALPIFGRSINRQANNPNLERMLALGGATLIIALTGLWVWLVKSEAGMLQDDQFFEVEALITMSWGFYVALGAYILMWIGALGMFLNHKSLVLHE